MIDVPNPRADVTALVLSGGGARAAYQVGVLVAIGERAGPDFRFPVLTGVSAGAINAAFLASTQQPFAVAARSIRRAWLRLSIEQVFRGGFPSLTGSAARWLWMLGSGGTTPGFEVKGLLDTAPLRAYLERVIEPHGIAANLAAGRLRALALSTTSYSTGRTVTFVECAPKIETWERAGRHATRANITVDHVMASSALPLIFPAAPIDGDHYGDGSVRQSTPLAPAIHLGANRLLAISVRYRRTAAEAAKSQVPGYPPPAQVMGMLMNAVFLDFLDADIERVERVNEMLGFLPPGTPAPGGLRPIKLLVLRPSRDLGKLSADLGKHLPRTLRILLRGLGSNRLSSPDFLSYLLFERPYIERLLELGYEDTVAKWDEVERFLGVVD